MPLPPDADGQLPAMATGDDITITRNISMQIKRRGAEMRLVIAGGMAPNAAMDSTFITAIARAHIWAHALLSGSSASMADLAARHGVSISYVKKIMPLVFLAPDIVRAIMAGRQPAHLTTQMLIRQLEIPHNWHEQRQALGFRASGTHLNPYPAGVK